MTIANLFLPTYTVGIRYLRPDGTIGSCLSSQACYAQTLRFYRDERQYPIVSEDWQASCGRCSGSGRVKRNRGRLLKVCPACKGQALWDVPEHVLAVLKGASK